MFEWVWLEWAWLEWVWLEWAWLEWAWLEWAWLEWVWFRVMAEGTIWDTFQVPKFKPKPDTCRNMSCTVDDFT